MRARINRLLRVSHWNPQAGQDLDWAGLGQAGAASQEIWRSVRTCIAQIYHNLSPVAHKPGIYIGLSRSALMGGLRPSVMRLLKKPLDVRWLTCGLEGRDRRR